MNRAMKKALRTLLQMVAGGGLAALFTQVSADIDPRWMPYWVVGTSVFVTWAQNFGESMGWWPVLFKTHPPETDADLRGVGEAGHSDLNGVVIVVIVMLVLPAVFVVLRALGLL